MKFGGSSVGTPESISNVKAIVERAGRPAVVVVSALGGVTDALIGASRAAAAGDPSWRRAMQELEARHLDMVERVVAPGRRAALAADVTAHLRELESILYGVSLIQDLTPKTADAIVAYGERLSSLICAALILSLSAGSLVIPSSSVLSRIIRFVRILPRIIRILRLFSRIIRAVK